MNIPKVGLLPLYVELYDRSMPELRGEAEILAHRVKHGLEQVGLEVLMTPTCRLENEFEQAISTCEEAGVDALVTVNLAYSPSLESEGPLTRTKLPLIILDTTPDFDFSPLTTPGRMMFNHGIHGVQDLCNRLVRAGTPFVIHAGPAAANQLYLDVANSVRGAQVVSGMRKSRVGQCGEPFAGMGDFRVSEAELQQRLGVTVVQFTPADGTKVCEVDVQTAILESESDRAKFASTPTVDPDLLLLTEKTGLAVRQWCEEQALTAFTINFGETGKDSPYLPVMPFLECSKAMVRGIGYAGEGDVLSAAWVGALLTAFPQTTFTEMFCPDWRSGSVFLSHMGEFNYAVAAKPPVLTPLDFPYTDAADPIVAYGTLQSGSAVIANLSPIGDGQFRLLLAPGTVLPIEGDNNLATLVNGWFAPQRDLPEFLEDFSKLGGIHHSALVYGGEDLLDSLVACGTLLGIPTVILD